MDQNRIIAYEYLSQAQDALKKGDRKTAQEYCDLARQTAPDLEEVWLLQASLAEPQESIKHLEEALRINPASERAQRGLAWARNRLAQASLVTVPADSTQQVEPPFSQAEEPIVEIPEPETVAATPIPKKVRTRSWITAISVIALVGLISIGWIYREPLQNGIEVLLNGERGGVAWSDADPSVDMTATPAIETPTSEVGTDPLKSNGEGAATLLPTEPATLAPTIAATETMLPTNTAIPEPSVTPTNQLVTVTPNPALEGLPSPTPLPTDTEEPGFVPYATPTEAAYEPPVVAGSGGTRWIDVNLSQQMVYAYEGDTLVNSFVASTGTWDTPTVTGAYNVYVKYPYTDMSGVGYYLADVPNTMYFYQGYAIHGTYWHSNFGTPMSHGCVNLSIPDSAWIFDFASVGTLVNVHY